jgi:hypothetical protein
METHIFQTFFSAFPQFLQQCVFLQVFQSNLHLTKLLKRDENLSKIMFFN